MELLKGLNQDIHPSKLPAGTWRDAMNIVVSKKFRDVSNEEGFSRIDDIFGGIVGRIEISDRLVLFLELPMGEASIVILEPDGTLTTVISDAALNFSNDRPIDGTFTYNYNQELIIVWWETLADDANPPRVLNVDCLPFELNVDKSLVNPTDIYLLKLFPDIGNANIDLVKVNDTGGNLSSGVYQFMFAYELSDNTITNYSGITNWIPVIDDGANRDFIEIDGCVSDTLTSKSITIQINNLDVNYPKVVIAVIKKIGGVISVVRTEAIPITGSVIEYTYVGDADMLDESLGNVIVPTVAYSHIKTGDVLGNRLYIANLRTQGDFDYQPYANNIKLKWARTDDVNLGKYTSSYKDPVFIVNKRGFLSGEVYAFYIVFKLKDGTFSSAYHIPARAIANMAGYGNLPENSKIADMVTAGFPPPDASEFVAISANARYHEVFSTALSTGELGVFENRNETYPDKDCWDIKNNLGAVIGTLRNAKIRHHRMPSIDQLETWGSAYYTPSTGVAVDDILSASGNGWGGNDAYDFTTNSVDGAYLTVTTFTDKYEVTAVVDFVGYFSTSIDVYSPTNDMTLQVTLLTAGGATTILARKRIDGFLFAKNDGLYYSEYVSLNTGDKIIVECLITGSPVIVRPTVDVTIGMRFDYFAGSDGSSKVLAITAHDIHIPADIAAKIDGFYFCYAERNQFNSLKVASGLMPHVIDDPGKTEFLLESFDLVNAKPPITPAFAKTLHYFNGFPTSPYANLVFESYTTAVNHRRISESFYLPANVTVPVNNRGRDSTYYMDFANTFNYTNGDVYHSELYNYLTDVYRNFVNQKLVLIPTLFAASTVNTGNIYGGDTFINAVGTQSAAGGGFSSPIGWLNVCETNANVGYRHGDEINNLRYIPRHVPYYNNDPYFGDYIGYNNDYTSLNNTITLVVFNCPDSCDKPVSDFPFRIHRSAVLGSEANTFGWRKFLTNEYREMPDRAKGEIWVIKAYNKAMIIYQKYSMYVAQFRDVLYTNDTETYLGTGDIFARDPDEVIPDGKGYAGNQSQYCTFVCKHGIIHVDSEQGKVFLFNGKLEELSAKGMRNWFIEFFRKDDAKDNPFDGYGYHGTFIENTNRIVLSKNGEKAQTISFSFDHQAWVSRHSYIGQMYAYNRNGSYIYADSYLYLMEKGKVGFYAKLNGSAQVREESYVDAVFAEPLDIPKVIQAIVWDTKVINKNNGTYTEYYDFDKTIDRIMLYNAHQCSGDIKLVNGKNLINLYDTVRNAEYNWKFNDFRDCVIDKNDAILLSDGSLNTANINLAKVWFGKSKFISKFVVVRMIMENKDEYLVLISNVNATIKKSER